MKRQVFASEIVRNLPDLLSGFARFIRDNKSVTLRIEVNPNSGIDFQLTQGQVFDTVYGLILALMNEAICSGKLIIDLARTPPAGIRITFGRTVVGHLSLGDVLQSAFPLYIHRPIGTDAGSVHHGSTLMTYELQEGGQCQVVIGLIESNAHKAEETIIERYGLGSIGVVGDG